MNKVYVLKEQTRAIREKNGRATGFIPWDYSAASGYGEIVFVTKQELDNVLEGSTAAQHLMDDLRGLVRVYDPENDWIIATGSPAMIFIAGMCLRDGGHTKARFLKWDKEERRYRELIWHLWEH